MKNALGLILNDMTRHAVEVRLGTQKKAKSLVLIEMVAKAKMVDVLADAYGRRFTSFHRKLANKAFGSKEIDLTFGVFFEGDTMVSAFCRDIADYDKETQAVKYKDLDEVLVAKVQFTGVGLNVVATVPAQVASQPSRPPRPPFGGGGAVVRYALVEAPTEA